MYHYKESGLRNIWLVNGYEITHDPDYGECVSIDDTFGLHRAIGIDLIHHKPKLTGAEFRFLRYELDLSQAALADLLGNDEQAVARWEKNGKVPKWADRMIRILVKEHYNDTVSVRALIDKVRHLDVIEQEQIVFGESSNGGWMRKAA